MAIKITHNEKGIVVAVDSETGQKEIIGTMEYFMCEVNKKRILREKVKKMIDERKH